LWEKANGWIYSRSHLSEKDSYLSERKLKRNNVISFTYKPFFVYFRKNNYFVKCNALGAVL